MPNKWDSSPGRSGIRVFRRCSKSHFFLSDEDHHENDLISFSYSFRADSLAKLRSRVDSLRALLYEPHSFKNIYRYAFDFSKVCILFHTSTSNNTHTWPILFSQEPDQRCLDIDTGRALLNILLQSWPLLPFFLQFLEESKYRVINKDQWFNVLEFSRTVSPDLSNYDEDGAWPVLLDEFVSWLRKNRAAAAAQQQQQTQLTTEKMLMSNGAASSPDHVSPCDSPISERGMRRKRRLCNDRD